MTERVLVQNVAVDGTWYGPAYGQPSGEVAALITNRKAWSGEPSAATGVPGKTTTPVKEPPRGGPGSGVDAWRAYADHLEVEHPESASAREIAALIDEHNGKG